MQSQSHANTQQDTPQLTESLLEDLLNPAMSPILICQIHGLTLTQLHTLTQSADYQAAIEAIQSINAARTPTIESTLHLQSLAALQEAADLTHQLTLQTAQSPLSSPGLHFGGAGEVSRSDGGGSSTLRSSPSRPSPVPTGEVYAKRTEGVFDFPPLPRGEGRGAGSSSLHLRTLESLRKSATTLLRETRPTPSRRPRKPTNTWWRGGVVFNSSTIGCHGLSSSQAVSSPPINKPTPPPNQLWHAVCDESPAGIWCPRRDTDTPTTEASHELRDSDLSIRSTHLHPPSGRTDREPRKPWNRRV